MKKVKTFIRWDSVILGAMLSIPPPLAGHSLFPPLLKNGGNGCANFNQGTIAEFHSGNQKTAV